MNNALQFLETFMTIVSGTPVKLSDGRAGVVVPAPYFSRNRVLVKINGGKKWWFRVDECTPILPTQEAS